MTELTPDQWPFWRRYMNLAQPRLGARILSVTDDFFGAATRLINPEEPIFVSGKYDDNGKWMDGWESRRKRVAGYDHCVVSLGGLSRVHGVDIDTRYFNGNQPLAASIEAASSSDPETAEWFELVPRTELGPDSQHPLVVTNEQRVQLLRLNIFPDGGVARLRVFGQVEPDWDSRRESDKTAPDSVDLVAVEHGGSVVAASDEHFGAAPKLLLPGRGTDMGDGWETRRRRGPGYDWVILALGHPGTIARVVIDTAHYKGNFPDRASIQAALIQTPESLASAELLQLAEAWPQLLGEQKLGMDKEHFYERELEDLGVISHVRLNIFPDGGVSRLRLFGKPAYGS